MRKTINFVLHRLGYEINKLELEDPEVLVYQYGKIGSSSVLKTLENAGYSVMHTHSHAEAERVVGAKQKIVITGVREPLGYSISSFFQNLDNEAQPYFFVAPRDQVLKMPVGELIAIFERRLEINTELSLSGWFSRFSTATGVDICDFQRKGNLYAKSNGGNDFYLYEFENMQGFFKDLKQVFPSIGELQERNVGQAKWYSQVYSKFKEEYSIERDRYIDLFSEIDFVKSIYGIEKCEEKASRFIRN